MNVVLDQAAEVAVKGETRTELGASQFAFSDTGRRRLLGGSRAHKLTRNFAILLSGRILLKGDNITLIQPIVSA